MSLSVKTICIIGGGFGGVRAALDCSRILGKRARVVLITPRAHFEYTPGLYRVVGGKAPHAVCIPLRDIFASTSVEICADSIASIDIKNQFAHGTSGSRYAYDYLVLAVGSETSYYNVPGLKELSFGFKTIEESLRLKRHLREVFSSCEHETKNQRVCSTHIVVVGGGSSGVELAAELSRCCAYLAKLYGINERMVTIDLFESADRILPAFPARASEIASARLRSLGVNIFTNRPILKEDVENVYLSDMRVRSKTVIWAAGIIPNALVKNIPNTETNSVGRILVDECLRIKGNERLFVIGDSSAVPNSGTAQAATSHGRYAARTIANIMLDFPLDPYTHRSFPYVLPLGRWYAMAIFGKIILTGIIPSLLRLVADFRFFLSILPFFKACHTITSEKGLCAECNICPVE